MTQPRLRLWCVLAGMTVLLLAGVSAGAQEYVDVPLAGQPVARLYDPGKFPTVADRAAKVQEFLAEVLSTQDTTHPNVVVKQESGIWVVQVGPVRVLSVLPKDATGAKLTQKAVAEVWGANLKKLLPKAAATAPPPATPPASPEGTTPLPAPTAPAAPTTPPAGPLTTPPTPTAPAPPVTPAAPVAAPMSRSAALLLVLDALNQGRALPEDQYAGKREKLASDLLDRLHSFLTGEPLPVGPMPAPATPAAPASPATPATPAAPTAPLPPAPASTVTIPAEWAKLPIAQRLVKKFELAGPAWRAVQATDPERYQQAGNLLSAARAAKAASRFEESEGYLDQALALLGIGPSSG